MLLDHSSAQPDVRDEAQALAAWRDAARLVSDRWARFLAADGPGRRFAFAAYAAALDAEEAAAADLAVSHMTLAA